MEGDLLDRCKVEAVLREQRIDAVMHFAAFAYVGESVTDPAKYFPVQDLSQIDFPVNFFLRNLIDGFNDGG